MYNITFSIRLENLDGYEIHIPPPKELDDYLSKAQKTDDRSYQLEYFGNHEIVCTEYFFTDRESIIIIPYFLNPGRSYPVQAYLHASSLYSSNPDMGQREAAESTRVAFGLTTFSHTTLSRTFKDLEETFEKSLVEHFGNKFEWDSGGGFQYADGESETVDADNHSDYKPNVNTRQRQTNKRNYFPTVKDTAERRRKMAGYLRGFHRYIGKGEVDNIGVRFAKAWYDKHRRLLI